MKTNTAVLHLKSKDPQSVYNLGGKVYTSMFASKAIFTNSDPTIEDFGAEVTKLDTAIKAKDGSKIKAQAVIDQTGVVYYGLKSLLIYVNKVANGDMSTILLSGFDAIRISAADWLQGVFPNGQLTAAGRARWCPKPHSNPHRHNRE